MTPEEMEQAIRRIEDLLEDQMEIVEDTNKVVHSIRRTNRYAFFAKIILWTLVIVLPFIFIGPIIKSIFPTSDTTGVNVFGIPSIPEIQKAVQTYRNTPQ
jgi:hypothetical protein